MSHLLIYGNAYAQIIRNGRGDVLGLYPLMPDKVRVDRDQRNRLVYIYSRYDEANPNLKQQGDIVLQAEDVLHIPGLGYDGLVGYSPIALAKNAIGISLACEDYGSTFFANGASPSGVLEHPGVIKNPERVRDAWQRAYGGSNSHHTAECSYLRHSLSRHFVCVDSCETGVQYSVVPSWFLPVHTDRSAAGSEKSCHSLASSVPLYRAADAVPHKVRSNSHGKCHIPETAVPACMPECIRTLLNSV